MTYDLERFPQEITHPSGETLVIDRSRVVVFHFEVVTALSCGRAASESQRSIAEAALHQPLGFTLEKSAELTRGLGICLEDGSSQPTATKINHAPWQLWVRSENDKPITQEEINNLGNRLRTVLGWPSFILSPVYRRGKTTGTESLMTPLPHVIKIKLQPSACGQDDSIAKRLFTHGLQEADISRYLPKEYRCFVLQNSLKGPVYSLRETLLTNEKEFIEDAFFDFMPFLVSAGVSTGTFSPNDPYYKESTSPSRSKHYQWNLHTINAEAGWRLGSTPPILGKNVIVAVIDSAGCELNSHPDLPAAAFSSSGITITYTGIQLTGGGARTSESHGTQCAGIIAARWNNSEGIAGLAGHCTILPIRIESSSDVVVSAAIGYAIQQKARVISMSFGGEPASPLAYNGPLIQQSITDAFKANVVLCAATMNNGRENFIPYPAAYPEVLACGASTPEDTRADFSNYGEDSNSGGTLSVVAPGVSIPTTSNMGQGDSPDKNYMEQWEGTSAATPHVAALAALIISVKPTLTSLQVKNLIEQWAAKVPDKSYYPYDGSSPKFPLKANGTWGPQLGYGRIDILKTLEEALKL